MTQMKLRIPLGNIEIDGDHRCAWVTLPDADAFIAQVLAAKANPGKAAVQEVSQ